MTTGWVEREKKTECVYVCVWVPGCRQEVGESGLDDGGECMCVCVCVCVCVGESGCVWGGECMCVCVGVWVGVWERDRERGAGLGLSGRGERGLSSLLRG